MPSEPRPLTAPRVTRQTRGVLALTADLGAGVVAGMTGRAGGVSSGCWASLNLGDHVGDDPGAVAENRARLAAALGVRPVYLRQVHGTTVIPVDRHTPDGIEADGCWSSDPAVACVVLVADCLPILFAAPDGGSVAAVHAGWRGLAGQGGHGILEALADAWPAVQTSAARRATRVWIGASIGPQRFEVGPEVRATFVQACAQDASAFRPSPLHADRWLADLAGLARRRLQRLGFARIAGNDGSPAWCTASQPSVFFSHRRDAAVLGSSGRMAAAVWRR
ncbi:peptidoglycan editing factor PgeF [Tepidimonas sp.]|uniref:peptidoglycan editing factor PgeF n=1 Tax=Tepidimonas sp. TaxID=2002775 RepID=UPI002FDF9AE9